MFVDSSVTLIESTTRPAEADPQSLAPAGPYFWPTIPVSVWTWGLGDSEQIEIQLPTDLTAPDDWVTIKTLTSTRLETGFYAPVPFRILKPKTMALCGVKMAPAASRMRSTP